MEREELRRREVLVTLIERRISSLEEAVQVDTQTLRKRWIKKLNELFDLATSMADPANEKEQAASSATRKERQMWAQIAMRLGEVMSNLAKGFDERQFNEDLAELERQVDEIKKLQAQNDKTSNPTAAEPEKSSSISNP